MQLNYNGKTYHVKQIPASRNARKLMKKLDDENSAAIEKLKAENKDTHEFSDKLSAYMSAPEDAKPENPTEGMTEEEISAMTEKMQEVTALLYEERDRQVITKFKALCCNVPGEIKNEFDSDPDSDFWMDQDLQEMEEFIISFRRKLIRG